MKFNHIFLALVCSISLFAVACSDGDSTSSNTPSANNNSGSSDGDSTSSNTPSADNNGGSSGGGSTSSSNTPSEPETLTVDVPSLGFVTTIDETTTFADINRFGQDLTAQCLNQFGISPANTNCRLEVQEAQSEALAFINS